MDHLPLNNTPMLVSAINMLLRDGEYEDLQDICSCFDVEISEIEKILAAEGYVYFPEQKVIR